MLKGYRVVELATHIAAPAATGLMADWGADVVKVERPEGDPMRWLRAEAPGGCSPVFEANNRGKRDIVLDVLHPEGREIFLQLVRRSDVFITSVRPHALKRAKLDWETLRLENPALVYASVNGYGQTGPDADLPAFDGAAFWTRSGMGYMTAPEGSEPFPMRPGVGDHTCSLATVLAVVSALLERTKTGKGRFVETSLFRAGVYVMGADVANFIRLGKVSRTPRRSSPLNPLSNYYQTSDGKWFYLTPRDSKTDWKRICKVADRTALGEDARYDTDEKRKANTAVITAELDQGFAGQTFPQIAQRLNQADLVWAPYQSPAELVQDPQALASGCLIEMVDGKNGGTFLTPGMPAGFDGEERLPKGPAPQFGEHTERILTELGLSTTRQEALLHAGVAVKQASEAS